MVVLLLLLLLLFFIHSFMQGIISRSPLQIELLLLLLFHPLLYAGYNIQEPFTNWIIIIIIIIIIITFREQCFLISQI